MNYWWFLIIGLVLVWSIVSTNWAVKEETKYSCKPDEIKIVMKSVKHHGKGTWSCFWELWTPYYQYVPAMKGFEMETGGYDQLEISVTDAAIGYLEKLESLDGYEPIVNKNISIITEWKP